MGKTLSGYLKGNGIEIGALNHPTIVPQGTNVRYVDYLDKDSLLRYYPELKNQEIVDVDVVVNIEKLDSVFPPNSLDFIILSHIIEHIEDPLGALIQCHKALRVGGYLYLGVPDKRATFDRARPRTLLSHLISDHEILDELQKEKRKKLHYQEWVEKVPQYYPQKHRAYQGNLEQLWKDRYCIHLHVWEPNDWPEIINHLNQINYPYSLHDYLNVFCPELRNGFVLILRKEESPIQQLQSILPEKGPLLWYITRIGIRLFIHPLKPFLRPLRNFWLVCRKKGRIGGQTGDAH